MLKAVRYNPEYKSDWDNFIAQARNSTFLFYRDYMDYHADRFHDCSFLFFYKEILVALIPGNIVQNIFYSHSGLTYGGLVVNDKLGTKSILDIFSILNSELKKEGISEVIYKTVPYIYHKVPSQEDLYALFHLNAQRIGCNISTAIYQENKIEFSRLRKRKIKLGIKSNIRVQEDSDFESFWTLMNRNLMSKYHVQAVHSVDEIRELASKFPHNIKLFKAELDNEYVAGAVVFNTNKVAHIQYLQSNELGRKLGAIDYLLNYLIHQVFNEIPIFDLGTSNEKMGVYLNENLIFQKEGFGARGVVYEVYKYKLE